MFHSLPREEMGVSPQHEDPCDLQLLGITHSTPKLSMIQLPYTKQHLQQQSGFARI